MEKLNEYLQTLLSTCGYELRLEPNKQPSVISSSGATNIAGTPLLGTQISTMIFPLIPPNIRQELPNRTEVEFTHAHNLGNFSFLVRKSPSGFNVAIRPLLPAIALVDSAPEIFEPPPRRTVNIGSELSSSPIFDAPPPRNVSPNPASSAAGTDDAPAAFRREFAEDDSPLKIETFEFENAPSPVASAAFTEEAEPETLFPAELFAEEIQASAAPPQFAEPSDEPPRLEFLSGENSPPAQIFFDQNTNSPAAAPDGISYPHSQPYQPPQNNLTQQQTSFSQLPSLSPPPFVQSAPNHAPTFSSSEFAAPTAPRPDAFAAPAADATQPPAPADSAAKARMDAMFRQMAEIGASDLHLSVSMPPMIRKDGKIQILPTGESALSPETMRELLTSIMPAKNQEEFARRRDSDFAYEIPGLARFRANVFMDRKGMGGVFRIIPSKILTAAQLGLSPAIMNLCGLSKGLVVVTGPTGSGKSTTLCAMIDHINKTREDHIITIEDPIEFTHENQKCLVNQREVHNHTDSFKDALRAALREDPDILLVGEMRDLETISIAIETAETGHLVFGTLHTTTAASTVDRIIDQFPPDRQQQIRVMLSESLKGVIAQTLVPKKGGGRVAALEVLLVTPAISNLIREGKTFQIPSAMQTGKANGMVMLNDALFALVQKGLVEPRDAYTKAVDKANFESLLQRGGLKI